MPRWDNLVLSTGLITWIGHRKEIPKLSNPFNVNLRSGVPIFFRGEKQRDTWSQVNLRWPIYIINPVDKPNYLVILRTNAAPKFLYKLTPFIHVCPEESTPLITFLFPLPSLAIATPQLGYKYKLANYTDEQVIGESTVKLYVTVSPSPSIRFEVLDVFLILYSKPFTLTSSMCRAVSVIICCRVRIPFKANLLKR